MLEKLSSLEELHSHLILAVLFGHLTIRDAQQLAAGTCDLDDALLCGRYEACHQRLARKVPGIQRALSTLAELGAELATLGTPVCDAFLSGDITLPQARYANAKCRDAQAVRRFVQRALHKRNHGNCPDEGERLGPLDTPGRRDLLQQISPDMHSAFANTPTTFLLRYVQGNRSSQLHASRA